MSSRAAILPTPGDPFLLNYWLKYFRERWYGAIDNLYIYYNSPIKSEVVDFVKDITYDPKIKLIYNPYQIDHGDAINRTLDLVTEDYVMLVEDDAFILRPDWVNLAFNMVETNQVDAVGSKRGSCSMEILSRARELWGLEYNGEGDQGCNFWPNFFFTKKSTLLATDRNFCGKAWRQGESIPMLGNYTVRDEVIYSDTFVNTSLQLRAMGLRFYYLPQYHGHPDDLDHFEQHRYLFDGVCPWFHVGSLSSGISGVLTDEHGRPLSRVLVDPPRENDLLPNYCNSDGEKREWERRVQWWYTFYKYGLDDIMRYSNKEYFVALADFHIKYGAAITRVIRQYGLSQKNIERRMKVYGALNVI